MQVETLYGTEEMFAHLMSGFEFHRSQRLLHFSPTADSSVCRNKLYVRGMKGPNPSLWGDLCVSISNLIQTVFIVGSLIPILYIRMYPFIFSKEGSSCLLNENCSLAFLSGYTIRHFIGNAFSSSSPSFS